jgi:hypothetical protein
VILQTLSGSLGLEGHLECLTDSQGWVMEII